MVKSSVAGGSLFGSPIKGAASALGSVFNSANKIKFSRSQKPKEFAKKRSEVTEKLDEDEILELKAKEERKLAKKAKRTIKPMPAAKLEKVSKKTKVPAIIASNAAVLLSADAGNVDDGETVNDESLSDSERSERTVFLGNLPISEDMKSITKLCSEFGKVESVRLRSVPTAGAKVDEAGNQNLVKKVCVNKKNFGTQKGSLNAYVVFKDKASVHKCLTANNRLLEGPSNKIGEGKSRHLRVDLMKPTLFPPSRSVFIGALPHYADEEEVRAHFAKVLPNGQADIESIRLVRDAETLVGKGIGYMLLKDRDAVLKALSLHNAKYHKRWELRVSVCGKRTKRVDASEHTGVTKAAPPAGKRKRESEGTDTPTTAADPKKPRWRNLGPEEQERRKEVAEKKLAGAALRVSKKKSLISKSLKTSNTRKRVLQEKGQIKKVKGRKGHRLGGNVKKAMKAAKKRPS